MDGVPAFFPVVGLENEAVNLRLEAFALIFGQHKLPWIPVLERTETPIMNNMEFSTSLLEWEAWRSELSFFKIHENDHFLHTVV